MMPVSHNTPNTPSIITWISLSAEILCWQSEIMVCSSLRYRNELLTAQINVVLSSSHRITQLPLYVLFHSVSFVFKRCGVGKGQAGQSRLARCIRHPSRNLICHRSNSVQKDKLVRHAKTAFVDSYKCMLSSVFAFFNWSST